MVSGLWIQCFNWLDLLYEYKNNTHKIVLFCKMSDSLTFSFPFIMFVSLVLFFQSMFWGFFFLIWIYFCLWNFLNCLIRVDLWRDCNWQMMNARQMCWCWKDCGVARRQGKEKSASWFCMWSKHLKCSTSFLSNDLYKSNNTVRIVLAVLSERMHLMFSLNANWPCSAY